MGKNRSKFLGDSRLRIITKKPKIRRQDLTKLKSICTARECLNKRKRTPLMAPHSSTLAWKIHGQRSLLGCSPCGR